MAWRWRRRKGAALELVHVVADPVEEPRSEVATGLDARAIADDCLRAAQARLRELACRCQPGRVHTAVRLGAVAQQLLEHLAETHADLVVICIVSAERARLPTIGFVAERLLRKAPCPVLAVPGDRTEPAADRTPPVELWPRNILVPTDFSVHAHAALTYAWDLAETTDAVLHVNDLLWNEAPIETSRHADTVDDVKRQLEEEIAAEQSRSRTRRVAYPLFASGEPAREILACADRVSADLIIMGTHGRSQIGRFVLGSVTHEVLEHTIRPVLVTHRD